MASSLIRNLMDLPRRLSDSRVPSSVRFCIDVAAESFDPSKENWDDGEDVRFVHPKTDEQRVRLTNAVNDILLFKCLDEGQIGQVIDAMLELRVASGDTVITQGESGDNFYVIEKGVFDIFTHSQSKPSEGALESHGRKLGSYQNKGSFGELALMYNTPRAASIVAATDGILWMMDRVTFQRIVLKAAFRKRQLYENLLEAVPLLTELSTYERVNLADALVSRTYQDGQRIISQGDGGNDMFFIVNGVVRITIKQDDREVEISRLQKGAYFGELALITKRPRAASAYAVGRTVLAMLDVGSFERLMGPCLDVMRRNINTYSKQLEELLGHGYRNHRASLRASTK